MKKGRVKDKKGKKRKPYNEIEVKLKQAKNRQKLFKSLDLKTAKFAQREFAKLGLY